MSSRRNVNKINKILEKFHFSTFEILKICKKIEPNNVDLNWLAQQISFARDADPTLIMGKSKDKLWNYRKQIVAKDIDFFMNNNFKKYIKDDGNKKFMYTLLLAVKRGYKKLSEEEKEYIWVQVQNLLECCIKYKMEIGDAFE